MKVVSRCLLFAALLALVLGIPLSAAEPPEKVVIDSGTGTKGAVVLNHKEHSQRPGVACTKCHHTMKDASDVSSIKKCTSCHNPDPAFTAPEGQAAAAKTVFHSLCMTCHKEYNEKEQKNAPVKCSGCHAEAAAPAAGAAK
jgi:hypothetical protein